MATCGIGGGGGGGLATTGEGEYAGAGAGFGYSFALGGAEPAFFLPRFRMIITTTAIMMISTRSSNKTATITPTSHSGKLDLSFPSAFACWLLWISRSTSECCGNILLTSSNFGIADE